MKKDAVIAEDFAVFLASGLSLMVGTRDAELHPDGCRAWALRVHPDGRLVTVYLYSRAAPAMLRNLERHPQIALCVDRPTDSRAFQLKGEFVAARRARANERPEVERQFAAFTDELAAIGIPRIMTAGWRHWPCVAIDLRVTEVFVQTPGPGAGEPLPAGRPS